MSVKHDPTETRRKFLKLLGGSAVLLPLAGMHGCGGDKEPAAAAKPDPQPAPAPTKSAPVKAAPPAPAPTASGKTLPRLSESDPQAKALGYVHDASTIDKGKQTRYQAGQLCSNCALFQAKDDADWAGCTLFPGKAVAANGWCAAYAPKV